ncbi:SPOR domain-containing protein [Flavisolibacter sp. BT320]|nr:SPOR domain-containing protein [Flavisolibacter longurius]
MFSNTGNLSLYLGIFFIIISFIGIVFIYFVVKKNTIEKEKLDKVIELGKWFIVSVAIVLSTSIVNDAFREREQDLKEIDVFDKYVTTVTKANGIEETWLLCEYFAIVSPEGAMQDSWKRYRDTIQPRYIEFKINNKRIDSLKNSNIDTAGAKILDSLTRRNNEIDATFSFESPKVKREETEWVIIAGGFVNADDAKDKVSEAIKMNYAADVYRKNNAYRTVIGPFVRQREAFLALPDIKKISKDAYVVRLNSWCENAIIKNDIIHCP